MRQTFPLAKILGLGIHVEQPGDELAAIRRFVNRSERQQRVGRVVVDVELAQQDVRAVFELDVAHGAGLVVDGDLAAAGNVVGGVQDDVVILHVRRSSWSSPRWSLKVTHGLMMSRIAVPRWEKARLGAAAPAACRRRRRSGRRSSAQLDGEAADVDRRVLVDLSALLRRPDVGGRRELALGQAVAAVVLDDVRAIDVAADHVAVLSEPDARRVAVAADAEHEQLAVGELRPGRRRGHASVQAVEAVRLLDEVGRRFRGAADAAHLRELVRLDAVFVERLDEMVGDRVVAAAGAQRRRQPFVDFAREADEVEFAS